MKNHKLNARLGDIMGQITQRGTVAIADLALGLNVSEETIRRDAKILEERGDILKLHGSLALPHQLGEAPYDRRLRQNADAKRLIAKEAVKLVEDGDTMILDTGTTTSIFAQELRAKRGLTVVTNSSDIARTLATVNGNRVYMAGGELKADNGAAFGPTAVDFLSRFKVRHAFISIGAIHPVHGPMDQALEEATLAFMALTRADNRVVLTDSSKFNKPSLVKVCDFADINVVVCDATPPADLQKVFTAAGIRVLVAEDPNSGMVMV